MGSEGPGRLRGKRMESLLLAIGGQTVFACLVALAAEAPPAIEATIAFGLALALGLELQGRHDLARARVGERTTSADPRPADRR